MASLLSSLFENHNYIPHFDSDSFERMMNEEKKSILLDVRTLEENKTLRIPNSKLIDIHKPNFLDQIRKLDRSKSYFIYCRSGSRSYSACRQMKSLGFEKVYNLKGGIINWGGETEQG
ncbi:MAG: rhodanese-like domain-containing protein [Ignavibacteriales bacterium]|nr:rhodanese-like domain-containing protein [Ignavibacteriales bacterium]